MYVYIRNQNHFITPYINYKKYSAKKNKNK